MNVYDSASTQTQTHGTNILYTRHAISVRIYCYTVVISARKVKIINTNARTNTQRNRNMKRNTGAYLLKAMRENL